MGSDGAGVDVVVPTRDTRELTLACVRSLADELATGSIASLTVVDNGSSDGTAAALAEVGPGVRVVRLESDPGYGKSCNAGASAGSAPYVLILNSDIVARPGAVTRLRDFLAASPAHVAAGGRLVDPGTDRTQVGFTVRALPTLATQLALLTGLERLWPRNPVSRRQLMLDFDHDRTQDAGQPAGACLIVRRDAYDALGGFDEGYFYWFEDVDLARRLHDRGRVAYVHDAVFEHVGGASFAAWPRPRVVVTRHRSLLRYFDRHHPRAERLVLRAVILALALARALAWLPADRARAGAYVTVARMAAGSRAPRRPT